MDFLRKSVKNAQTNPSAWLARREIIEAVTGSDEGVFVQDYSLELRMAARTSVVRLDTCVFLAPAEAPGRLSERGAQTLHDVNLAVLRFARTHQNIPISIRRYAVQRAAARAWSWARRHNRAGYLSRPFVLMLAARLGLLRLTDDAEHELCAPFRVTPASSVRLNPR
jgi:hypothetical protein